MLKLTVQQIFQNAKQEILKSNFNRAIDDYKLIIKIEPNNYTAYLFLGLTLRKAGRTDEAKESYLKVIKLSVG